MPCMLTVLKDCRAFAMQPDYMRIEKCKYGAFQHGDVGHDPTLQYGLGLCMRMAPKHC